MSPIRHLTRPLSLGVAACNGSLPKEIELASYPVEVGGMDRFIRRQNVDHFRRLLETVTDHAERNRILKLLSQEQQKQNEAEDPPEE
jgi:hypothetical protein